MLDKLFNITGTAALYGFASLFLASLLFALGMSYAWDIDSTKRAKMLAIAQGHDLAEIAREVEEYVARMTYEEILERRARHRRDEDFQQGMSIESELRTLLDLERRTDAQLQQVRADREAFDRHVNQRLQSASSAGMAEATRLLEEADAEWAKNAIIRIIRDRGDIVGVLTMLLDMEDRNRGAILYEMTAEDEEEMTILVDLLQRIAAGEPRSQIIEEARNLSNTPQP